MQFRDVRDYEGLYKVNDQAQVWGIKKKQFLKPFKDKNGYFRVILCKNNKIRNISVHKIVFEAFYRRLQPNEVVHHISQVKTENNPKNLVGIDYRLHSSRHNTGKKHTEEEKQRMSQRRKGYIVSQQMKRKISKSHIGKKMSPEAIAKREATKRERGITNIGRKHSKETLQKMSISRKKAWENGMYNDRKKDPLTGRYIKS